MERKSVSIQPVERIGKIAPVLPVRFFKPFPDQSERRRMGRPKEQLPTKEQSGQHDFAENTIDLKI
ncbi:hypothetical protein [Sporomusa aerivorans]|uniref:hypothetical protein n=1 Tax=Sporomusa aerivorans TaxID=204936 RepID=UPI00352B2F7C